MLHKSFYYIFCVLVICFSFSSCLSGSKKNKKTAENNNYTPPPRSTTKVDKPLPTKPKPRNQVDTPKKTAPLPTINKEFDIALLLPFNTQINNLDFANDSINDKSEMALDFYEGASIALEELKDKGLNAKVYVYDTQKDKLKVKDILAQPHLKDVDLIIGPVYNAPLAEANAFAKKNKVHLVSPLSPTTKFVEENPYYITVNQSIETHSRYMYDFMAKKGYKDIVLLHRESPKEQQTTDYFKSLMSSSTGVEHIGMRLEELVWTGQDMETLETYLVRNKKNIFVITSFNEAFANNMLRILNGFSDRYDIVVFGMPNWNKFETLDLDHLENLNFHISSNFYENTNSPKAISFAQKYKAAVNELPNEYAYKGYDIVKYFGKMLERRNEEQELSMSLRSDNGAFSGFQFSPVYNPTSGEIDYFENQKLYILQFRNFQFKKVD